MEMKTFKMFSLRGILGACAIAAMTVISSAVHAAACSGFLASDGSACAVFTLGTGTADITLTNFTVSNNNSSVVDFLSDLSFTISGGTGTFSSTSVAPGGNRIRCIDGATGCTGTTDAANNWFYSSATAGHYLLTALQGSNKSLIAGDVSGVSCNITPPPGGHCPDAIGNQGFQPYLDGSATFHLAGLTGVTSGSTVTNVAFSFGTAPEVIKGVPIPAAVWLFGSGLLGLIGVARRRMGVSNSLAAA
jgi:hypothetical protein